MSTILIKKNFFSLLLLVVFAVGLTGIVQAQPPADQSNVNLDITVQNDDSLSGNSQAEWLRGETVKVKGIYRRVQTMLDKARRDKDTIKITCLDDKLTQIHVNLRGIEERIESHKIAIDTGDNKSANQQFAILQIYMTRIKSLMVEAENCIGDVDVVLGETQTTVTVDDNITMEDPAEDAVDSTMGDFPSIQASGYY